MATKRKKEEQLLKSLRQLTALSHNKKCLECQQRGPTYADMTTHGFVCTSCGGYLRGLNPPHRVKSISMTTFSEDELTLLKDGGNELAHAVWMGRWNPRQDKEASKKDEVAFKEFLISKYERKMWYKAEVKRESEAKNESSTPTAEAKILPPPSTKRSAGTAATFAVQPPSSTPAAVPVTSATPQPTLPTATSTANTGSTGQQKPDLLGGVDDPFAPKRPPPGGVAVLPPGAIPFLNSTKEVLQPGGSGSVSTPQTSTAATGTSAADKYSALASLDITLKGLRVKDEPPPQPSPQTAHRGAFGGGGGGGGSNPFGAPQQQPQQSTGPAQFNPFATPPSQPVTGGLRPGGPGYGGFQGQQFQPAQQFGGFGGSQQMGQAQMQVQMANPQMGQVGGGQWQQQPQPMQGAQWGLHQQSFQQGQMGQWVQQNHHQQQAAMQQQWRPAGGQQPQVFGSVPLGSGPVPGGMNRGTAGGGFLQQQQQQQQQAQMMAMQQSQFGGFVSAAGGGGVRPQMMAPQSQQQQQQQAKQFGSGGGGGGFNWGTSTASQQPTSSSSGAVQTSAGTGVRMGWSNELSKQAPPSSGWGGGSGVTPASSSSGGGFTGWSNSLQTTSMADGGGWGGGGGSVGGGGWGGGGGGSVGGGGWGGGGGGSVGGGGWVGSAQQQPQQQQQQQQQQQANWGAMGNQPSNPFMQSTPQTHKNPFL